MMIKPNMLCWAKSAWVLVRTIKVDNEYHKNSQIEGTGDVWHCEALQRIEGVCRPGTFEISTAYPGDSIWTRASNLQPLPPPDNGSDTSDAEPLPAHEAMT